METISTICYFSGRNARERIHCLIRAIEFSHGSEKGKTLFESTGVGKQLNHNHSREILLTDDPWSSKH